MNKTAKTYRFNPITLQKLNELINYYSDEYQDAFLQHPGQFKKITATGLLEYLIMKEHAETVLKNKGE